MNHDEAGRLPDPERPAAAAPPRLRGAGRRSVGPAIGTIPRAQARDTEIPAFEPRTSATWPCELLLDSAGIQEYRSHVTQYR